MITYFHTVRERELLAEADRILSAAAIPRAGWEEEPGGPFYLFLLGVHLTLFHPVPERSYTLRTVYHRVWGRIVPHSTLTTTFARAGLRVRPYQLMLLYRASAIALLIYLGAKITEVRNILGLSPMAKVYTMLARLEGPMSLKPGTLLRMARDRAYPSPDRFATRVLRSFIPCEKPGHAAWWIAGSRRAS